MLSIKIFFQSRKYFAPAFLYTCFSLIFSTWVTYIPYIAEKLNITEGKIGGAIFFSSLGSFFMIPITNRLVDKIGVGRYAFYAFILYTFSLINIFLAKNYAMLCFALFCLGFCSCAFAISLNSLTATIEKRAGKYIMTGSHGFWSIGGIIGASTGSFLAGLLKMPLLHVSLLVVVLLCVHIWLRKEYYDIRTETVEKEKHKKFPFKPLLVIASIGLIMMVSEGAIADWSALYLKKIAQVKVQYIGLGYALFAVGMAIGRFNGDALSNRIGSWKLLRLAIVTSLVGFTLVLLTFSVTAFIGFFIIGLGFSIIVPEIYRLASTIKGVKTADGVSFIAATANIGFMTGPVLLGFIAELHTLHLSFIVLSCFVLLALVMTIIRSRTE